MPTKIKCHQFSWLNWDWKLKCWWDQLWKIQHKILFMQWKIQDLIICEIMIFKDSKIVKLVWIYKQFSKMRTKWKKKINKNKKLLLFVTSKSKMLLKNASYWRISSIKFKDMRKLIKMKKWCFKVNTKKLKVNYSFKLFNFKQN